MMVLYLIVSVLEEAAGFMCREYLILIVKTQKTSLGFEKNVFVLVAVGEFGYC
jgi:hypothetical protein